MDVRACGPLLLVAAIFVFAWGYQKHHDRIRVLIAVFAIGLGLRYLGWRLTATVLSFPSASLAAKAWVWMVYLTEVAAFIEIVIFLVIMSRTNTRHHEADRYESLDDGWSPAVDVFIPTYNEPIDVLEKTILGARAIDYADKTVWVLDDGRRDWLRDYCADKDVRYVTREDNSHAKAGNMNNGLRHATGSFIAIFDADFVPSRRFIARTIGFFRDETIGIVQTPQHFFNRDPVQTNLHLVDDWPDEQRLFFDEMAASRDAWNAAFCCGSCSIIRRQALDAVGGFPTQSITEDLLTTLVMLRQGYKTRYLNEKLSMGLAPESLQAFFVQRARWCRGGIQTLFLRDGPLGPGLTPLQRLLFLPLSWLIQYPVRLMLLAVPLVYLLTGAAPLAFTTISDMVSFQLPVFLTYFLAMRWLVGGKYLPILSLAVNTFTTFRMLPTVLASLIKPFGEPFRVTPKGSLNRPAFEGVTFSCLLATMMATVAGLIANSVPEWRIIAFQSFYPVAVAWALLNLVILGIASLICFEAPRRRQEERFRLNETTEIRLQGRVYPAVLQDVSVSGARVKVNDWWDGGLPQRMAINISDVGWIEARPIRLFHGSIPVEFLCEGDLRDRLITKLFSGRYDNSVDEIADMSSLARHLLRRAFGKETS